jgi:hypothetical protein
MVIYLAKAPAGAKKALSFASWHITNEFTFSLQQDRPLRRYFQPKKAISGMFRLKKFTYLRRLIYAEYFWMLKKLRCLI